MDKKKINFDEHYDALLRYINEKWEFPKDKEVFEDYNLWTWYNAQYFKLKNNMLTNDEKEKILSLPDLSNTKTEDSSAIDDNKKINLIEVRNDEIKANNEAITTDGIKIIKNEELKVSTTIKDTKEELNENTKELLTESKVNNEVITKIDNNSSKDLFLKFLKLSKDEINITLKEIITEEELKYNKDLKLLFEKLNSLTSNIENVLQDISDYSENNTRDYHVDWFNGVKLNLLEDNENYKKEVYDKFSVIYKTYINSNVNIQAENFESKKIDNYSEDNVKNPNDDLSISDTKETTNNTSIGGFSIDEEDDNIQEIYEVKEDLKELSNETDQEISISTVFSWDDLQEKPENNDNNLELEEPIKIKF